MYVKIHVSKDRNIVAICDEDLMGKKFSEKNLELDISERFYKGEVLNNEETSKIMMESKNINITGKKSIALAIKCGIIDKKNIIKIQNVPHAQVYEL
nr:DUF424 domain-containing protein [Nanoarchaeum sp.]